jgi:stringent starvation protein B
MTSQRPYLLRALYEWIADNGMTPHVLVDAGVPGVRVPPHVIKDGQVVLNIAERAVGNLQMGNDALRFSARFGGVSHQVVVPVAAVIAIYARETGQGMALPPEPVLSNGADEAASPPEDASAGSTSTDGPPDRPPRGPRLRIVK